MDPVTVGIVGLSAIGASLAVAFAYGALGVGEHRYEMSGAFEEAANLEPGSEVRLAGIEVGEVTAVEPDRANGQVIVTWEVDEGVDLGPDTTADVQLANLLGGEYIRLSGPVEEPYLAELPAEERRIPLERTSVPFPVSETLGDTAELVAEIDSEATNELVASMAEVATGSGPALEQVLDGLSRVGATLTEREAVVGSLLEHTEELSRTLASRDDALAGLVSSSRALLDEVVARRDQLAQLLGDGAAAVQSLTGVIDRNRAHLDAVLGDLSATLAVVDRQQAPLDETLSMLSVVTNGVARVQGGQGPFQDATFTTMGPDVFGILAQAYPAYGVQDVLGQAGFGPFLQALGLR